MTYNFEKSEEKIREMFKRLNYHKRSTGLNFNESFINNFILLSKTHEIDFNKGTVEFLNKLLLICEYDLIDIVNKIKYFYIGFYIDKCDDDDDW